MSSKGPVATSPEPQKTPDDTGRRGPREADSEAAQIRRVLELIADETLILQGPGTLDMTDHYEPRRQEPLASRDIDCAVSGMDPMWPLRLEDGWRVCQRFHYDLRAWFWVLERHGRVVCVDTLQDPGGLGRDGFPTSAFTKPGLIEADPGLRGAYLTAKRIRKGIREKEEWERIGRLSRVGSESFWPALRVVLGPRLARLVGDSTVRGDPPLPHTMLLARSGLFLRRFRTPGRFLAGIATGARREAARALRPTGLVVLVAGPDGSGKSTLAARLAGDWDAVFRRTASFHWRPGLLPRPGAMVGREAVDPSTPHVRSLHTRALSTLLTGYFWLDFVVGDWLRLAPIRARSGLVIVERGWWDLLVDPRRYRLDVPQWLLRLLGEAVPRPDLAFVLESDPATLRDRKPELEEEELARQRVAWRSALPPDVRTEFLDADRSPDDLEATVRERALEFIEERTVARMGSGWAGVPSRRSSRWLFPRGPRRSALRALDIFQPMTPWGLTGWGAARLGASLGAMRLLPRSPAPPAALRRRLAPHLPPHGSLAVAKANHAGRYIGLIVDRAGSAARIAKVAVEPRGEGALEREASTIERVRSWLSPPLHAPNVVASERGLLVMEAERWRPRRRPWMLDRDVAWEMGRFFAAGSREGRSTGPAHGDFAPWNLLRTDRGWVLIDWEFAFEEAPPMYDVFHYLFQASGHLGRPSRGQLIDALRGGEGWIAMALRSWASGAGLDGPRLPELVRSYLDVSMERLRTQARLPRRDMAFRTQVARELKG